MRGLESGRGTHGRAWRPARRGRSRRGSRAPVARPIRRARARGVARASVSATAPVRVRPRPSPSPPSPRRHRHRSAAARARFFSRRAKSPSRAPRRAPRARSRSRGAPSTRASRGRAPEPGPRGARGVDRGRTERGSATCPLLWARHPRLATTDELRAREISVFWRSPSRRSRLADENCFKPKQRYFLHFSFGLDCHTSCERHARVRGVAVSRLEATSRRARGVHLRRVVAGTRTAR